MGSATEILARTLRELEPYADDIVLVGGWVHTLYLVDVGSAESAIRTDDIDITIPRRLYSADRRTLVELAISAGFERDPLSDLGEAPVRLVQRGLADALVDLDILTESHEPMRGVPIEGQPGLVAQGYPGQRILLENWKRIEAGPDIHETLDPPINVRVPTVPAYVLHRGFAWQQRTQPIKQVKDLTYLVEILRHPLLGSAARSGIPELATAYPDEYRAWREGLRAVTQRARLLDDVCEELLLSARIQGTREDVRAAITAQIRRALGETPALELD